MTQPTPIDIQDWLEWAGAKLIAMPVGRLKPAEPHVIWPDYSQEKFQILEFRGRLSLRAAAPNKDEIAWVDEILTLPHVCRDIFTRRVLHTRCLVHPINSRHLFPWSRIAKLLQSDPRTVKSRHKRGLVEVVARADAALVCRITAFMAERLN